MTNTGTDQGHDHFGKLLLDSLTGLFLGGIIGFVFSMFLPGRINDITNVFHPVFAMRYAVLSAAVAGALAAVMTRCAHSAEIWWVSMMCTALLGAIVGSLTGFIEFIWPPHVHAIVNQYSVFEFGLAALVPGIISSLLLGWFNKRKKSRLKEKVPVQSQPTTHAAGYGEYTEF